MLQDMYLPAVENGIASDQFWGMTLEEILVQSHANQTIKEKDTKLQANMDYRMAQLMTYAFNKPESMPKFNEMYPFDEDEEDVMTAEEKEALEMKRDQQILMMNAELVKATRLKRALNENK